MQHPSFKDKSGTACLVFHTLLALAGLLPLAAGCSPGETGDGMIEVKEVEERATSFAVRGWGAVYLRPEPGNLEIVVEKQDLNRLAGADILLARLLGPDRETIAVARFPDDGNAGAGGGAGPLQRAVFQIEVTEAGLYKLDLEARTGQEMGHDIVWGISTNAAQFAVESLLSFMMPGRGQDIYFYPPENDFNIQVRGIGSRQTIRLFDDQGEPVESFDTREDPVLETMISGHSRSGQPWRLQLEDQRASVRIGGVTDFSGEVEDFYPGFGYWSPDPVRLFRVEQQRWLITPRQLILHPGEGGSRLELSVYNGGDTSAEFGIAVEFPNGVWANVEEGASLLLPGKESGRVTLAIRHEELSDGEEKVLRVRVEKKLNPKIKGWATIRLRGGSSPAQTPLNGPLKLEPYRHENALFGYHPDYVPNVPYFDPANRPFIRSRGAHRHHSTGLEIFDGSGWRHADYMAALKNAVPDADHGWFASYRFANKVAFDPEGGAYTLLSVTRKDQAVNQRQAVLLHTRDRGRAFEAHRLGGIGDAAFELEAFTGHNPETGSPPVLLYRRVADHPAQWAWLNELNLFIPKLKPGGRIELSDPVKVSDRALNPAAHSGGGSPLATRDGLTFVVWGEAVDSNSDAPGVPSYISVYDHSTGEMAQPRFLAHAPPINDSHNSPALVLDSEGFIHVVVGAHGRPFQYLRSLRPLRIDAGWTEPVDVLSTGRIEIGTDRPERGAQTYVGLVCGPDDTLHLVSRQWREGVDPWHDGHLYAALSYQRKRPDGEWEEPVPLVIPPLPNYSVYYHKLSIDRLGRLYLAYNYYSTHEHYRNDFPGRLNHQAVLMSADGGDSWKLADTIDFQDGISFLEGEAK